MLLSFRQNAGAGRTILEAALWARGVVLALLIPFVHGCMGIPVSADPSGDFIEAEEAEALVGQPIQAVYARFGPPQFVLPGTDVTFHLYTSQGRVDAVWEPLAPFLVFPVDGGPATFCAVFETDQYDQIIRFDSTWKRHYRPRESGEELIDCCLGKFKTNEEVEQIKAAALPRLRDRAEQGDTEAAVYLANGFGIQEPLTRYLNRDCGDPQFMPSLDAAQQTAYTRHIRENHRYLMDILCRRAGLGEPEAQWSIYALSPCKENLKWLCRAADNGHLAARNELGTLYLLGSGKYKDSEDVMVSPDIARACMWFHLSGRAAIAEPGNERRGQPPVEPFDSPEVADTAKVMTATEIEEAEMLISRWGPGQCYRDLPRNRLVGEALDQYLAGLCAQADRGNFSARDELGRIYFLGTRGVERDLPRAYMWYQLAAEVYAPPAMRSPNRPPLCDAMTPEERTRAINYLEQWQPGQCERNLLHE